MKLAFLVLLQAVVCCLIKNDQWCSSFWVRLITFWMNLIYIYIYIYIYEDVSVLNNIIRHVAISINFFYIFSLFFWLVKGTDQSARTVEYTDCFSAAGYEPTSCECPGYDIKQSDELAPVILELWGIWITHSVPLLTVLLW